MVINLSSKMEIKQHEIAIRDVVANYSDSAEEGVYGYGGKLNIRPKYQREFVYNEEKRNAVIDTILKGFPLNTMYWMVNDDGTYEVLDGQQRTISICQYYSGDFSIKVDKNSFAFNNLTDAEKKDFLDYKLQVYFCKGNDKERLNWFQTINISGEKLTNQEIRNAVYACNWTTDAKRYFSKTGCPASDVGSKYLSGSAIRQDYLETAIKWIADTVGMKDISDYMAEREAKGDKTAVALWNYFQNIISWVKAIYPEYNKAMKGIEWGLYYNKYKDNVYDPKEMIAKVHRLIDDDEVQSTKGIYEYLLDGDEKHLNLRQFSEKDKQKKYQEVGGICKDCGKHFEFEQMEGDHIIPWHDGGKTEYSNLSMLCKHCNRTKSGK